MRSKKQSVEEYIANVPPAIEGSGGDQTTFDVAMKLVHEYRLDREDALEALRKYNQKCVPPWSEKELQHKVDSAFKYTYKRKNPYEAFHGPCFEEEESKVIQRLSWLTQ